MTYMRYTRLLPLLFLPLLGGCETIGNWADDLGQHMPVIGERCEHWQCFTSSGQEQSEMNKRERMMQNRAASAPPAPPPTPPPAAQNKADPQSPYAAVPQAAAPPPAPPQQAEPGSPYATPQGR